MVDRLRRAITPRTRAVGLTWVHSSTGLRLPIAALAEVVKAANAGRADADRCLLIVDGVHGFGCSDTDAASLGCDFFVAGTHKWIFGAARHRAHLGPRRRLAAHPADGPELRVARAVRPLGGEPAARPADAGGLGGSRRLLRLRALLGRGGGVRRSTSSSDGPGSRPASPSSTAASAPRWRR